jgi:hypothetical protein
MTREQLKEASTAGTLYVADVTETSAYVYFEPTGKEHEHAAHYRKVDGVWTWENGIYGDLVEAVGGEAAEAAMLELLGLHDE